MKIPLAVSVALHALVGAVAIVGLPAETPQDGGVLVVTKARLRPAVRPMMMDAREEPAEPQSPPEVSFDAPAEPPDGTTSLTGRPAPVLRTPRASAADLAVPVRVSPGKTAGPSLLEVPTPEYPAVSRRRREEGDVLIGLEVKPDGEVREIEILRSSGFPALDRAALQAASHARYRPGLAAPQRDTIQFTFQLR